VTALPDAGMDRDTPWVVALGLFAGASALGLSLTGLLGRLTTASVLVCLLLALALSVVHARRFAGLGVPRLLWMALPFLAPSLLAALFLPPYHWDDVAYGAALPRDFARAGRFYYNADYGPASAFPANYEALVTASLLLTHDVRLTQALNVAFGLGMAVTAAGFARALGAARLASLVAGLFVLCSPALIDVMPQTKNDVAVGFFELLSLLVLARTAPIGNAAAVLSGAFLGVALGTKYSALQFAVSATPIVVLVLLGSARSRAEGAKRAALWAATLALVASPWYLRNLLLFSDPLFPFANDLLGAHNGLRPVQSSMLRESISGLTDFSLQRGTLRAFAARTVAGFGWLPCLLLWPGIALALRRERSVARILLAGTAVTYLAVTVLFGYWEPRYFVSLLCLASALAGLALTPLVAATGRRPAVALASWGALALVAALALSGAAPAWAREWQDVRQRWRQGEPAFVEERVHYYAVARWLNTHLGARDRVAIGFNVQPFYYLDVLYYHIHPLTEGTLVLVETPEELLAALRSIGADYLAFSGADGTYFENTAPQISDYRERLWRAQRKLRQAGRLRLVDTIDGVRILRVEDATSRVSTPPPN
jgi:hypothetical protein